LQGQEYGGPPVDIYALGVILYCLINGRQPFVANNPYDMLKFMNDGLQFDFSVSKELRDLLSKMLTIDPKKRITLAEIRIHPFTMKNYEEPPASYVPKFRIITSIDESVMREVVALGFEDNQVNRQLILKNKVRNSEIVTAYQLCLNRSPQLRRSQELKLPAIASAKTPDPADGSATLPPPLKRSYSSKEVKKSTKRPRPRTISQKIPTESERKVANVVADGKQDALDLKDILSEFDSSLGRVINDITHQNKEDSTATTKRKVTDKRAKRATISGTKQSPGEQIDFDNFDKEAEELRSVKIGKLAPVHEEAEVGKSDGIKKKGARSSNNSANNDDTINGNPDAIEQRNTKLSSSFKCDTTSSKSTKEIKKKIISAAQKCSIQCDKVSKYEFKLTKQQLNDEINPVLEKIVFDIEIVKMKDFKNLKGLRFKRLEGDIWAYKTIAESFLISLKL
jgi:serine/threonine protein kinase